MALPVEQLEQPTHNPQQKLFPVVSCAELVPFVPPTRAELDGPRPAQRFGAGGESGPGQWRDRHGVILGRNLRRRWIHSPVCKAQRFKDLAVNQKVLSSNPVWGAKYFPLRNSL